MKSILEIALDIGIEGFLQEAEFLKLIELAAGKDVLEVGSYRGLSAYGMAWTAKSLMCVDTFQAALDGQRQTGTLGTLTRFDLAVARFKNVTRFVGTSAEAAGHCDVEGQFDLIFIDAMHDYQNVKADISRWWPRVRSGGMLAIHDYYNPMFPGVTRAADEMFGPAVGGTLTGTLRCVRKLI